MFKSISTLNIKTEFSYLDVDKHKTKTEVGLEPKGHKTKITLKYERLENIFKYLILFIFAEFCSLEKLIFL